MTNLHVLCPFLNICACLWFYKVPFLLWNGNESGETSAMVASLGEWTIWGARGGGEQRKKEKEGGGRGVQCLCCSTLYWDKGGCTQPPWRSATLWDLAAVMRIISNMIKIWTRKQDWGNISGEKRSLRYKLLKLLTISPCLACRPLLERLFYYVIGYAF